MSDTNLAPAFYHVSSNNHSSWVVATSYIFLIFSIIFVATKLVSRFQSTKLTLGDGFMLTATALALMQTIFITYACNYGLGRHMNTLDASSLDLYSKYFYAAQILLIPAQAFTKASIVHFIMIVNPYRSVLILCQILLLVIALWTISGIFALAFRCELPKPWISAPGRCIDQQAMYTTLGTINIITDVALIVLPIFMIWSIQTSWKTKLQVMGLFAGRFIVPVFMILNIAALSPVYSSRADPTWYDVLPTIYSQIMLNLSILTACLPSLKRIIDTLRSGTAAVTIDGPYELSISGGHTALPGFKLKGGSKPSKGRSSRLSGGVSNGGGEISTSKFGGYGNGNTNNGRSSIGLMNSIMSRGEGKNVVERSDSIEGLTDNVIAQTLDHKVEFDEHSQRDATLHSGDGRSGNSHSARTGDDGNSIDLTVR